MRWKLENAQIADATYLGGTVPDEAGEELGQECARYVCGNIRD
jgi:hypothetical protein